MWSFKACNCCQKLPPSQVFNKNVQCKDSLVTQLVENFNNMTIYTHKKKIKCKNYVLGIDETYWIYIYIYKIGWTPPASIFGIQTIMDQRWISPSIYK